MEEQALKELKPLSASKVKTFEECSWKYFCQYVKKIPQLPNTGASMGTICHLVFEMLLSKNRQHLFNKIIQADSITIIPSIERLVRKQIKKLQIKDVTTSFALINKMILVGLKNDFYGNGGELIAPEFAFDILSEEPKFHIRGFMDKPFIRGQEIIIDDFKSAKQKYAGEERDSNLQALFYSLASKILYPNLEPTVRFIFLQHEKDPMVVVKFSEDALLGFKYYLEAMQERVEGFNENVARTHFAADDPPGEDCFTGKLLCGFSKHIGHLKKDGLPMWGCPFKFKSKYYSLKDENGNIIQTSFNRDDLDCSKGVIDEEIYFGCPRFANHIDSIQSTPVKTYPNAFDDFL